MNPQQFIVSKALEEERWLAERQGKITATLIANAHTERGREEALGKLTKGSDPIPDNAYMEFGRRMEPFISMWVKEQHGILPNDWLIAHEEFPEFVATPDGISLDHSLVSEVKTTGKDWGEWKKVPVNYRRQVQWQMYVTGAETCLFAWLLREERNGQFMSPWLEPKSVVVERDEKLINAMVDLADSLLEEIKELA
jgi:putative phage-type endonuclease